jgi:hypothetical protein
MKIGAATTREERLTWPPDEALALVLGPSPDESATVALAMVDQLAAAAVPIDAVELSIVVWSRALDGLGPGAVPADRLARLDQDLLALIGTAPVLARWSLALRSTVATANHLDWAIRFLMQVHQTWTLTAVLRGVRPAE